MHDQPDNGDGPTPTSRPDSTGARSVSPRLVAFLVIAVVAAVFVLQNREPTTIHFLNLDVTTRVWLAIVIAIVLGALLDRLFLAWWRRRRNKE